MQSNIVLIAGALCVGPIILGSIVGAVSYFVSEYRIVLVRR